MGCRHPGLFQQATVVVRPPRPLPHPTALATAAAATIAVPLASQLPPWRDSRHLRKVTNVVPSLRRLANSAALATAAAGQHRPHVSLPTVTPPARPPPAAGRRHRTTTQRPPTPRGIGDSSGGHHRRAADTPSSAPICNADLRPATPPFLLLWGSPLQGKMAIMHPARSKTHRALMETGAGGVHRRLLALCHGYSAALSRSGQARIVAPPLIRPPVLLFHPTAPPVLNVPSAAILQTTHHEQSVCEPAVCPFRGHPATVRPPSKAPGFYNLPATRQSLCHRPSPRTPLPFLASLAIVLTRQHIHLDHHLYRHQRSPKTKWNQESVVAPPGAACAYGL